MQKLKEYKLDRISPSMISTYLDCPKLFYYSYIAKIQLPQKQLPLVFGSAVHKALEEFYNGDPEPHHHFIDSLASEKHKLQEDELADYPNIEKLGLEMVTNYIDYNPKLEMLYEINKGSSEHRFKMKLVNPITGQESTLPYSGVLDRITDSNRIIEFKTAKQKWDPDSVHNKPQNLIYNMWYHTTHGEVPEEMVYIILLKKFKTHKYDQTMQVITSNVSVDDIAAAWEEVELIVQKIQQGIFECSHRCAFFSHKELARYEEALLLQNYKLI